MLVNSPYKTSVTRFRISGAADLMLCLISVACLSGGPFCLADEVPVEPDPKADFAVTVQKMRLTVMPRPSTGTGAIFGQLEVRVAVTNQTAKDASLEANLLKCTLDGNATAFNAAIPDGLLSGRRGLPAGETAEGWLAFMVGQALDKEPKMVLSWEINGEQKSLSLNDALRKITTLETKRVGPGDTLAVITVQRQVDHPSIWLLNEEFRRLHQQGVDRVVVEFKPPAGSKPTSYTYTNSSSGALMSWLSSAMLTPKGPTVTTNTSSPVSPVQFREIYVVGASSSTRSPRSFSSGRRDSVHQRSRDRAIAQALGSAYEDVSVEQAMQHLQDSEPGIRLVAMESVIDRLSAEQLATVLQNAAASNDALRTMLAENLYRSALPEASIALNELANNKASATATAATKSLVRSVAPLAAGFLKQLWHKNPNNVPLRQTIATEIITRNAYIHTELLAEFAEQQLTRFAAKASADQSVVESPKSSLSTARPVANSADAASLKLILSFFRAQGNLNFEETARRELLNISDPKIQDMLLDFVLATKPADASSLAGQYIEQRLSLPSRSRTGSSSEKEPEAADSQPPRTSLTTTLFRTVRKYPNTKYAPALLEFSKTGGGSSSYRSDAFRTGVRCASDRLIRQVIDDFDDLETTRKTVLLGHLALIKHPMTMAMVEACLEVESTRRVAVSVLRNDPSPEAMQLIVRRLDDLRIAAEADFAKQAASAKEANAKTPTSKPSTTLRITSSDRVIAEMLALLVGNSRRYIHPDARRVMNLLRRSPVEAVAKRAALGVRQSAFTLPADLTRKIAIAYELQEKGQYVESKAAFLEILEDDPFYVHAHTALASLDLREGRGDQAMERLKIADRMNPEDIHTQSMIALAEIRIGNIQAGIKLAEQLLESVPDLPTSLRCDTLYNTACTYGRAIEGEKDAGRLQEYRVRGMALLRDCVNRTNGFHDSAHILADPDLNVFHKEEEWPMLMETIKENEAESANVKP